MADQNIQKPVSVIVLGGAGAMGRVAVETIQNFVAVGKVVVADINLVQAQKTAADMNEKVEAMALDAMDDDALAAALSDHDYVVTTLGPFYKFGPRVLRAAIKTGIDYIDICDDWEPTLELLSLDAEAKKAGIRALIGGGASPGISNMLAVKAMQALDRVDTLYTGWGENGTKDSDDSNIADHDGDGPAAAVEHWVQQFTGLIRVRENGQFRDTRPLQKHVLPHPDGGECTTYSLGHPEAVTFPVYYPEIRNSYNVMDMSDFVMSVLKNAGKMVDSGQATIREAASHIEHIVGQQGQNMSAIDTMKYMWHSVAEDVRGKKYMPDVHATAMGQRNGHAGVATVWMNGRIPGGMGPMTCIPTAIFLSLFIDNVVQEKGVFAPEHAVDPDAFFDRLEPFVLKDSPTEPFLKSMIHA